MGARRADADANAELADDVPVRRGVRQPPPRRQSCARPAQHRVRADEAQQRWPPARFVTTAAGSARPIRTGLGKARAPAAAVAPARPAGAAIRAMHFLRRGFRRVSRRSLRATDKGGTGLLLGWIAPGPPTKNGPSAGGAEAVSHGVGTCRWGAKGSAPAWANNSKINASFRSRMVAIRNGPSGKAGASGK